MSQVPSVPAPQTSPASLEPRDQLPPALVPDVQAIMRRDSWGATLAALARALWRAMTLNRKVTAGSAIVGFFVLVAIFGPLIARQDPLKFTRDLLQPPSAAHWLGTNQGGQDVFTQLVIATSSSLGWALLTGLIVMGISITVGLVSGFFGGIVDDALSLVTNVFIVIPGLPLAIIAVQYFSRTTLTVALVVALTSWAWGARVLRAQTFSMRAREFVTAARASGEHTGRLIFAEIFPNELSIVAASFITTTIQVLLGVAGLEFLGFGDTNSISWGLMLNGAYTGSALFQAAWWWFVPPGICIALLGSGLALLNFGIDEIADPRLRVSRRRRVRRGKAAAA